MKFKIALIFIFFGLFGYAYWYYDINTFVMPESIETTPWATSRAQKELSAVSKTISSQDVRKAYKHLSNNAVVHYSIRNNSVVISVPSEGLRKITYYKVISYVINQMVKKKLLKDSDFIVWLHDQTEEIILPKELAHVPVFVFAKDVANDKNAIKCLIVDSFTLKSWTEIYADMQKASKKHPWEKKINKLFWRGKTTDAADVEEFRLNSPRANLAKLTKAFPDRYDARLTKILSVEPKLLAKVKEQCGDIVPFVSISEHVPFKYQVTLDGLTATFPGYVWRMASGCLNIKQDSTDVQWFYELFQPNVHYLPVKRDLSNIDEVLKYAESHDAEMKQMAIRARDVVEKELTPSKVFGYFVCLLNTYADRIQFKG